LNSIHLQIRCNGEIEGRKVRIWKEMLVTSTSPTHGSSSLEDASIIIEIDHDEGWVWTSTLNTLGTVRRVKLRHIGSEKADSKKGGLNVQEVVGEEHEIS